MPSSGSGASSTQVLNPDGLSETRCLSGTIRLAGITEEEPAVFNEPVLYRVEPDGSVDYASILSVPAGRPPLYDPLGGIEYWVSTGHPAHGGG